MECFFTSQVERIEPTDEWSRRVYCACIFAEKGALAVFILPHFIEVWGAAFDSVGEMRAGLQYVLGKLFCFIF